MKRTKAKRTQDGGCLFFAFSDSSENAVIFTSSCRLLYCSNPTPTPTASEFFLYRSESDSNPKLKLTALVLTTFILVENSHSHSNLAFCCLFYCAPTQKPNQNIEPRSPTSQDLNLDFNNDEQRSKQMVESSRNLIF